MTSSQQRFNWQNAGQKYLLEQIMNKTNPRSFSRLMGTCRLFKAVAEKEMVKIVHRELQLAAKPREFTGMAHFVYLLIERDVFSGATIKRTEFTEVDFVDSLRGKEIHRILCHAKFDSYPSAEIRSLLAEMIASSGYKITFISDSWDCVFPPSPLMMPGDSPTAQFITIIKPASLKGNFFHHNLCHFTKVKKIIYKLEKFKQYKLFGWIKKVPRVELIFHRDLVYSLEMMHFLALDLEFGCCSFVSIFYFERSTFGEKSLYVSNEAFVDDLKAEFQFDGSLRKIKGLKSYEKHRRQFYKGLKGKRFRKDRRDFDEMLSNVPIRIYKTRNVAGKEIGLALHVEEFWAYIAILPNFEDTKMFL